jgi:hypothetical protein
LKFLRGTVPAINFALGIVNFASRATFIEIKFRLEVSGCFTAGRSQKNSIIRKLSVAYFLGGRGDSDAWKGFIYDAALQLEAQDSGLNNIEQRGQRTSLSEPPRSLEELGRAAIDQGSNPRSRNAGLYPSHKLLSEPKFPHYCKQEIMSNPIKGVGKIQLNCHSFLFFFIACVNGFLN